MDEWNRNFLPDVGPLIHVKTPTESESVRVETGAESGDEISGTFLLLVKSTDLVSSDSYRQFTMIL
jgi:acetyl/propionyl-CoA carboxylase alpha subunit